MTALALSVCVCVPRGAGTAWCPVYLSGLSSVIGPKELALNLWYFYIWK